MYCRCCQCTYAQRIHARILQFKMINKQCFLKIWGLLCVNEIHVTTRELSILDRAVLYVSYSIYWQRLMNSGCPALKS